MRSRSAYAGRIVATLVLLVGVGESAGSPVGHPPPSQPEPPVIESISSVPARAEMVILGRNFCWSPEVRIAGQPAAVIRVDLAAGEQSITVSLTDGDMPRGGSLTVDCGYAGERRLLGTFGVGGAGSGAAGLWELGETRIEIGSDGRVRMPGDRPGMPARPAGTLTPDGQIINPQGRAIGRISIEGDRLTWHDPIAGLDGLDLVFLRVRATGRAATTIPNEQPRPLPSTVAPPTGPTRPRPGTPSPSVTPRPIGQPTATDRPVEYRAPPARATVYQPDRFDRPELLAVVGDDGLGMIVYQKPVAGANVLDRIEVVQRGGVRGIIELGAHDLPSRVRMDGLEVVYSDYTRDSVRLTIREAGGATLIQSAVVPLDLPARLYPFDDAAGAAAPRPSGPAPTRRALGYGAQPAAPIVSSFRGLFAGRDDRYYVQPDADRRWIGWVLGLAGTAASIAGCLTSVPASTFLPPAAIMTATCLSAATSVFVKAGGLDLLDKEDWEGAVSTGTFRVDVATLPVTTGGNTARVIGDNAGWVSVISQVLEGYFNDTAAGGGTALVVRGSVHGVVDTIGGSRPLPRARVYMEPYPARAAPPTLVYADESGHFELPPIDNGAYNLVVSSPETGHVRSLIELRLSNDFLEMENVSTGATNRVPMFDWESSFLALPFFLVPGSTFRGEVLDARGESAGDDWLIDGATLRLCRGNDTRSPCSDPIATAVSDVADFELRRQASPDDPVMPADSYTLWVSHPDYIEAVFTVDMSGLLDGRGTMELEQIGGEQFHESGDGDDLRLWLDRSHEFTALVEDEATRELVPSASLILVGPDGAAEEHHPAPGGRGRLVFSELRSGTYRGTVGAPGRQGQPITVSIPDDSIREFQLLRNEAPSLTIIDPVSGSTTDQAVITVRGRARNVRGQVTLEVNGSPRQVTVTDSLFETQVPLLPGVNTLVARANDVASEQVNLTAEIASVDIWSELTWDGPGDVDFHLYLPNGEHCYYQNQRTESGAHLDIDNTEGFGPEHITMASAPPGEYRLVVNYFSSGAPGPVGYSVTLRLGGVPQTFRGTLTTVGEDRVVTTFTVR